MGKKILIDVTERGRNGGRARAAAMSDEELSGAARRAVNVRWTRVRAAKLAAKPKRKRGGKAAA
jgi:hypothetical protein